MADVGMVDVSLRDGNQSLWGATGLRTAHVMQVAPLLERVGFRALDYTSSTAMGVLVRTHRENPWELFRRTRELMPRTKLQFIGTGFRFISWQNAHPETMQLVYDRLAVNGIDRVVVLDPMHDMDAARQTGRRLKQAGIDEVVGALTFTISAVHDDAFYADLARQMAECPDIDRVYVKDPAGILSPERARTLLPAIKAALGAKPLELHSHATIGFSPQTYVIAPELGVEVVQTGCGPLGNGSSLPEARRTVANLRETGHHVDIDDRALGLVCDFFDGLAAAEELPVGRPQDFDAAFLHHQIAGGVMTTTRRQLREIGMEDRFESLVEEVGRVRAELGFPIMVTPFPQMVVSQALFNVMGERYANVSDQVIRYATGGFGRPTAPIAADVLDRILDRPRARELQAEPPPPSPVELRRQFGRGISDEELLLRAHMPGEQVDAMMAAGPAPRHFNPVMAPVLTLLRELGERETVQDLAVGKPDLRLFVHRRKGPLVPEPVPTPVPAPDAVDRLRRVRGFVLDMDGTLVLGDRNNRGIRPLPGAVEFVRLLVERDLRFCVFTNGTVKTPKQCADALERAGFPVTPDAVLTPATSAIEILRRRGHQRVMVLGGKGITEPLEAAGIETVPPLPGTAADAVLAGWYRQELTFESLEAAVEAVSAGAAFYSASQSPYFATAEGRTLGTSRAISAVVRDVTGCTVTVVGKPSLQALHVAARHLGLAADELAVVGDDPELEVPMALQGGALAVAVHTGIGHARSFTELPADVRPHLDLADVGALARLLMPD